MNFIELTLNLLFRTIYYVFEGVFKGLRVSEAFHWIKRKIKRLFGHKVKYELRDFEVMSGKQFEHVIQDILENNDYRTKTLPWNDYGADLIAEKEGLRFVIQCKRYSQNVGLEAVQEAFTACRYYNADKAWVVTNSSFTFQAERLAEKIGVRTINGKELEKLLS